MHFNRMIVINVERETLQEAPRFIYNMTTTTRHEGDELEANHFDVALIELLDNGWAKVTRHDTGIECFPPSRIVTLELNPVIHAVTDRPSNG